MRQAWLNKMAILFIVLLGGESVAYAIPPLGAFLPPSAEPGLAQKRLTGDTQPPLKSAPSLRGAPNAQPGVMDSKIHFKLNRINLEGNTVYSTAELQKLYQDKLGQTISLADLEGIVYSITKKYRENGYILSRAILPPQTIKGGIVKVQVIEGFIDSVTVSGNPGQAAGLIKAYGDHVVASRPLQSKVLERYVLLANDLPGYTVRAVLTPSKTTPGGADLDLVTERRKAGASIAYDNYGTRYLGPKEFTASGSVYSVLKGGDSTSVTLVDTTKGREMRYAEIKYTKPWGDKGTKILLDYNYTHTRPEFTLQPFNIVGNSTWIFGDLSYPIIRTRADSLVVHSQANYQNVFSTIAQLPFYQDRLRTIDLGLYYEGLDRYRGLNDVVFDVNQGFSVMGADKHTFQSRPLGNTGFTIFTFTASRLQGLTSRLSLLLGMTGQYCAKPLLATEQFAYGGPNYGRGYDPSEIVGDRGIAAKAEFRVDTMPELRYLNAVQYYAFYDIGKVRNWDSIDLVGEQSAASTGVGARFVFMPNLTGNFFLAKPLTRPVATVELQHENGFQWRTFFQIIASV